MRVDESTGSPPALGTVGSPNQATSYSYSALDNLTRVTQGSQSRTFVYDSLSRLTSATNPESGTTSFSYDKNGNLTERTDARGVEATYSYDALNRLTERSYSYTGTDSGVSLETTRVDYAYDNCGAYSEGRLCSVTAKKGTTVVSKTAYANYDALGRVGKSTQTTGNQDYTMRYGYDRAGNLISQTYPSGKVVETAYDEVGRVAGVKRQGGSWYAGAAAGATGAIGYEPHGGIRQFRLGNLLWEQRRYNARLQPTRIGLGTVEATGDTLVATATGTVPTAGLLLLNYSYGTTANNGNVVSQQIQVGDSLDQTQTYTYDKLNRLTGATERRSGTETWSQTYQYDVYGNRAVTAGRNHGSHQALTPSALTSFNASTNRLLGGAAYDGAGNLTLDWGGRRFKYDGDNRMVSFDTTGVNTDATYHYDGEGRRVKRVVGGVTTTYVYNAGGQLVAEYATSGTPLPGIRYLTPDHLGSTRVVTQAVVSGSDGGVVSRHDYLPFGEEIGSLGGRTAALKYSATGPAQKFTGKERDNESGLDYFGARYFSGAGGRFTSVDPALAISLKDPQTWNRYVYVKNRPLTYVDPNGLWPTHIHNQLYREALPGLSESQLEIIKKASQYADTQLPHMLQHRRHYTRRPTSRGDTARQQSIDFINQQIEKARKLQTNDVDELVKLNPDAIWALAMALHAATDSQSPAHRDQDGNPAVFVWGTRNWPPFESVFEHRATESQITEEQRIRAIGLIRMLFELTFGTRARELATGQERQQACVEVLDSASGYNSVRCD